MPALDPSLTFWHLVGFATPAVVVAALTAAFAKLLWPCVLRPVAWWRMALPATFAGLLVSIAGLVAFGQDGRIATYAGLVLASAVVLWWVAFDGRGG